jgi:hypothetical protein
VEARNGARVSRNQNATLRSQMGCDGGRRRWLLWWRKPRWIQGFFDGARRGSTGLDGGERIRNQQVIGSSPIVGSVVIALGMNAVRKGPRSPCERRELQVRIGVPRGRSGDYIGRNIARVRGDKVTATIRAMLNCGGELNAPRAIRATSSSKSRRRGGASVHRTVRAARLRRLDGSSTRAGSAGVRRRPRTRPRCSTG